MEAARRCGCGFIVMVWILTFPGSAQAIFPASTKSGTGATTGGIDVSKTPVVEEPAVIVAPMPTTVKEPVVSVKEPLPTVTREPSAGVTVKEPVTAPTVAEPTPTVDPAIRMPSTSVTVKEPIMAPAIKTPTTDIKIREPVSAPAIKTPTDIGIREPALRKLPVAGNSTPEKKLDALNAPSRVLTGDRQVKPSDVIQRTLDKSVSDENGRIGNLPAGNDPSARTDLAETPDLNPEGIGTIKSGGVEYVVLENPWRESGSSGSGSGSKSDINDAYFLAALASLAGRYGALQSLDDSNQSKEYWLDKINHAQRFNAGIRAYLSTEKAGLPGAPSGAGKENDRGKYEVGFGDSDVSESADSRSVDELRTQLKKELANPHFKMVSRVLKVKKSPVTETGGAKPSDINSLAQTVLRESNVENSEALEDYAAKVQAFNDMKAAVRNYLREIRADREMAIDKSLFEPDDIESSETLSDDVLMEIADSAATDAQQIKQLLQAVHESKVDAKTDAIDDVSGKIEAGREQALEKLQHAFSSAAVTGLTSGGSGQGDKGNPGQIDRLNAAQKQQQTMQMLSQAAKTLHDSALSVVRRTDGGSTADNDPPEDDDETTSPDPSDGQSGDDNHGPRGIYSRQADQPSQVTQGGRSKQASQQTQKKKPAANGLEVGFARQPESRAGRELDQIIVKGDAVVVRDYLVNFIAEVKPGNRSRQYMENKLVEMNDVVKTLARQVEKMRGQVPGDAETSSDIDDIEPEKLSLDELRRRFVREYNAFKKVSDKIQNKQAAFENFDQKANQMYNLLSSVMKAMNEMRMGTTRNML